MKIVDMKKWIRHSDLQSLLENGMQIENEMVTLCLQLDWFYEKLRIYPILVNTNKSENYLKTVNWDFYYSRPKIVIPNRRKFLGKIANYNLTLIANKYKDTSGNTIALIEKKYTPDTSYLKISMNHREIKRMISDVDKVLFFVIECFRYSERTLDELKLKDDKNENYFKDYCYSISTRPMNKDIISKRDIFSTISIFRGKGVYKIVS